jgi:UrcA family protein
MFISTKFATAIATAALIAGAGSASATTSEFKSNGRHTEVYHGDLDLSKGAHQQELHRRIARAASRVCSSQDLEAQQACRSATIAQMQAPVNAAIARADTGERYADASVKEPRPQVGN